MQHSGDEALDRQRSVECDHLLLVPDVLVAECVANGVDMPDTWTLCRDDGRVVHVYANPKERTT